MSTVEYVYFDLFKLNVTLLSKPESITILTFGIVIDASAIFVANII